MSNEELVELIQQGVDVNENMGILYQQNRGLIRKWAYPYINNFIDIEDLMQEAYFGLVKATESYDSKRNEFKFMTYAQYKILQKIIRYSEKNRSAKRIPSHMLHLMSKYHKYKRTFIENCGEKPTQDDFMNHLQINKKQLKQLVKFIGESNCVSFETPIGDENTIGETISDDYDLEEDVVKRLFDKQMETELWKAVDELDERHRDIIIQRYKNQKTFEQIAKERELTKQRIEQLELKARLLLRKKQSVIYMAEVYGYDCRLNYKYGVQKFKDTMTSSTEYIALKNLEIAKGFGKINDLLDKIVNL